VSEDNLSLIHNLNQLSVRELFYLNKFTLIPANKNSKELSSDSQQVYLSFLMVKEEKIWQVIKIK